MIQRSQMVTLCLDDSYEDMINVIINTGHTRFPVFDKNKEEIVGILHTKELLVKIFKNNQQKICIIDNLQTVIFIPESKRIDSLLSEFKQSKTHIAVVFDEYGEISGLVSLEDILEEIVGDIEDEFDKPVKYIKKTSENEYIIDAIVDIKEFNEYFNSSFKEDKHSTISGLLLEYLEYLPVHGEVIKIKNFTFIVEKRDNRKIFKLLLKVK